MREFLTILGEGIVLLGFLGAVLAWVVLFGVLIS